jgi:NAD+ diphosphatase
MSNITKHVEKRMKFCPTCSSPLILSNRDASKDNLKVLKCEKKNCNYQFYNNPTPVVGAIVEHINEKNERNIILVRGIGWPKEWFGLVTGFLEYKEDPSVAVVREIEEELGLTNIKNEGLIGLYPFERMNQLMIICKRENTFFTFQDHCVVSGEIKLDKQELEEYKLVSKENLKPWEFGTGNAVKDWLKKSKL